MTKLEITERAGTKRREPWSGWPALIVLVVISAVLEVASRAGLVSGLLFPPPSRVVATLAKSLANGEITAHLMATLGRMIPGLVIGAIPGLTLGLLMGRSRRLRRVVDPFIAASHPVPKIALLPLFMLLLGIGEASKIAIVALAAFFPCLINAMAGARSISPLYLEVARSYGAGPFQTFTRVLLPGSLPVALSGLRLAANVAIVVTIAIELVASDRGLGSLVWLSWEILRVDLLYATILVTAGLGIGLNSLLAWASRRVAPWAFLAPPH
jgi:NitT/TauT family transport system permease protein